MYIFNIKKQTDKQKTRIQKKQKKLQKKWEYLRKIDLKKKYEAARVKIFLATRISGNKRFFYLNLSISISIESLQNKKPFIIRFSSNFWA